MSNADGWVTVKNVRVEKKIKSARQRKERQLLEDNDDEFDGIPHLPPGMTAQELKSRQHYFRQKNINEVVRKDVPAKMATDSFGYTPLFVGDNIQASRFAAMYGFAKDKSASGSLNPEDNLNDSASESEDEDDSPKLGNDEIGEVWMSQAAKKKAGGSNGSASANQPKKEKKKKSDKLSLKKAFEVVGDSVTSGALDQLFDRVLSQFPAVEHTVPRWASFAESFVAEYLQRVTIRAADIWSNEYPDVLVPSELREWLHTKFLNDVEEEQRHEVLGTFLHLLGRETLNILNLGGFRLGSDAVVRKFPAIVTYQMIAQIIVRFNSECVLGNCATLRRKIYHDVTKSTGMKEVNGLFDAEKWFITQTFSSRSFAYLPFWAEWFSDIISCGEDGFSAATTKKCQPIHWQSCVAYLQTALHIAQSPEAARDSQATLTMLHLRALPESLLAIVESAFAYPVAHPEPVSSSSASAALELDQTTAFVDPSLVRSHALLGTVLRARLLIPYVDAIVRVFAPHLPALLFSSTVTWWNVLEHRFLAYKNAASSAGGDGSASGPAESAVDWHFPAPIVSEAFRDGSLGREFLAYLISSCFAVDSEVIDLCLLDLASMAVDRQRIRGAVNALVVLDQTYVKWSKLSTREAVDSFCETVLSAVTESIEMHVNIDPSKLTKSQKLRKIPYPIACSARDVAQRWKKALPTTTAAARRAATAASAKSPQKSSAAKSRTTDAAAPAPASSLLLRSLLRIAPVLVGAGLYAFCDGCPHSFCSYLPGDLCSA